MRAGMAGMRRHSPSGNQQKNQYMASTETSTRDETKNRLIVALDMPTQEEATRMIATLGDSVGFYKIGLELLFSGGLDLARSLSAHGHKVFLDLKFLDIGHTVERAVANAVELGPALLTIHGHDVKTLHAAVTGRSSAPTKLLAVTVLTSLTDADLRQQGHTQTPEELVLHRAKMAFNEGFDGVIASGQEAARIRAATSPEFLIVTPGIRLGGSGTDDQERVMTPERAISAGADHLVIGRPITEADDPQHSAKAFLTRIATAVRASET